jgi:hypothetical protein
VPAGARQPGGLGDPGGERVQVELARSQADPVTDTVGQNERLGPAIGQPAAQVGHGVLKLALRRRRGVHAPHRVEEMVHRQHPA